MKVSKAIKEIQDNGIEIAAKENISNGINSQVYKLIDNNGQSYALKFYSRKNSEEMRSRCMTENNYIEYLNYCNISNSPKRVMLNKHAGWSLLSWIEGEKIKSLDQKDLREIISFIDKTNRIEEHSERANLQNAAESLQSIEGLVETITRRIETIKLRENNSPRDKRAAIWIKENIESYLQSTTKRLSRDKSHWKGIEEEKIASPSDVGVHNTLRTKGGLAFIDFEYAGLDDLSKLAADWILQPEYSFNKEQEKYFVEALKNKMLDRIGENWVKRLEEIKPLIHIKWCLIIMKCELRNQSQSLNIDKLRLYLKKHKSLD